MSETGPCTHRALSWFWESDASLPTWFGLDYLRLRLWLEIWIQNSQWLITLLIPTLFFQSSLVTWHRWAIHLSWFWYSWLWAQSWLQWGQTHGWAWRGQFCFLGETWICIGSLSSSANPLMLAGERVQKSMLAAGAFVLYPLHPGFDQFQIMWD